MRFELQAVGAIVQPDTGRRDPFSRGDHRGMTDGGHQIPVPPRLHPQHTKPVLGIVEGDPFYKAGENFGLRVICGFHGQDYQAPLKSDPRLA